MIYVVSGFMRTGTSMMMKALEAGGLEAAYSEERNKLAEIHSDEYYHPNKNGLYELSMEEQGVRDFPRAYDGKLLKVMIYRVPALAVMPGGIKVIFMRRDMEEVRQSYDAFFERKIGNLESIEWMIQDNIQRVSNRKDVTSAHEYWYRDVLDNPKVVFEQLKRNGWPINVEKAIESIDPSLCHFKKEDLEIGIP